LFHNVRSGIKRKFPTSAELTPDSDQAMDTDPPTTEQKPKTRKVKKQVRRGDLPIVSGTSSLDQAIKDAAAEREGTMFMEDKLVIDTEDKKNELETYIYDLRGKIDDEKYYATFASEEEKEKLKAKLEQAEV
jgi:heat shock protein 4